MKYYVITPAKDEEKFIKFTLDSMVNQLLKPAKWIIVDDGSTDNT
ncbi:MAG TPA: glycosyltransferase family A protein, partial [Bacteroidia bacterium]|nr:glycosyltransferase family A protein [Bacteroidia bacterium]